MSLQHQKYKLHDCHQISKEIRRPTMHPIQANNNDNNKNIILGSFSAGFLSPVRKGQLGGENGREKCCHST